MTWDAGVLVVGVVALVSFALAFHFSGLATRMRNAAVATREAMGVLTDGTPSDSEKERLVQHCALRLFGHAARTALTLVLVLSGPGVVLWVGEISGVAPFAAVWTLLLSWEAIVGHLVIFVAVVLVGRRG